MSWRSEALAVFEDIGRFPPKPDRLPKLSRAIWDLSAVKYNELQVSVFKADAHGLLRDLWVWAGALDLFISASTKYPKEQRDVKTYETIEDIFEKSLLLLDIFEIEANLYVKGGNHEKCESIFQSLSAK